MLRERCLTLRQPENKVGYNGLMQPIYLDYNATTPVDPAVFRAMLPFLGETTGQGFGQFGNPSSTHIYGRAAHLAVDLARRQCAELLGSTPDEVVFTSGGSEASN